MSPHFIRSVCVPLALAVPVAAQAGCWKEETVRAAMVRDLDTMLMVGALRCRNEAAAYHHEYNAFVIQSRAALLDANEALRRHFREEVGPVGALGAYDRYTVKVANRYGGGAEGLSCLDLASIVDAVAAEVPQFDALVALAQRAEVEPLIEGPSCNAIAAEAKAIAARSMAVAAAEEAAAAEQRAHVAGQGFVVIDGVETEGVTGPN